MDAAHALASRARPAPTAARTWRWRGGPSARSLLQGRLCRGTVQTALQPRLHIGRPAQVHLGCARHHAREIEVCDRELIADEVWLPFQVIVQYLQGSGKLLQRLRGLLGIAFLRRQHERMRLPEPEGSLDGGGGPERPLPCLRLVLERLRVEAFLAMLLGEIEIDRQRLPELE